MEKREGSNNTVGSGPGDDTLLGTQLEVISQLADDATTLESKFQITSAVGLEFADGKALFDALNAGDAQAAAVIIDSAAQGDPRFARVLSAAQATFAHAADEAPPSQDIILGRDGFPNFRVIFDFSTTGFTATFQTHTILDFKSTGDAQDVLNELPGRNADAIVDAVTRNCVIHDTNHLKGMLRSAVS